MTRPTKIKQDSANTLRGRKKNNIQPAGKFSKISKDALRILSRSRKPPVSKKNRGNITAFYGLTSQDKCECPICLELLIAPVLLQCGHIFCLSCFEESNMQKARCSLCRNLQLDDPQRYLGLQTLIRAYVLPNTSEGFNYWCRQAIFNYCESKRKVFISFMLINETVDVKDSDNLWKEGRVLALATNSKNECIITINIMEGSSSKAIELSAHEQRRLATAGYYTQKKYIEYRKESEEIKIINSIQIPEIQGRPMENQRRQSQRSGQASSQIEEQNDSMEQQSVPSLHHEIFHEVKEEDDVMMQLFDHQMRNVQDFLCL